MTASPRFVGVKEFVEELTQALASAPLGRGYRSKAELCGRVREVVARFLQENLGSSGMRYALWQGVAEPGSDGIVPVPVLGAVFVPDLTIDVEGMPTVAFDIQLIRSGKEMADKIGAALGTSLCYAQQYPAVILFLYHPRSTNRYLHLLDRELMMALWSNYKIRVVLR